MPHKPQPTTYNYFDGFFFFVSIKSNVISTDIAPFLISSRQMNVERK